MNPAIDITHPEAIGAEVESATAALAELVTVSEIVTADECRLAVGWRQRLGEHLKRIDEFFNEPIHLAHLAHKRMVERKNTVRAPIEALDRKLRTAIGTWNTREERERRERERILADEERKTREARAASEAAALEADGDHASAAAVLNEAIAAPAPVVALPPPKIEGLKVVRRWLWKYTGGPADIKNTPPEIVRATLDVIPREFLGVDEKKVGAYARSMKASGKIPGIDIYAIDDPVR